MSPFPSRFIALTATSFTLLAAAGCRTAAPTNIDRRAFTDESEIPFLQRGDYPERLGVAVQGVLNDHGFSLPWIALRGPYSSVCFVAERFKSTRRFDRVYVRVTSAGGVRAAITAYQFGPSDWAILGRLFADFGPEANSIATEITKKLND